MKCHEMIQLRGNPFPKPLPRPASEIVALFKTRGIGFEDEDGVLRFRGSYDPSRLIEVKQLLSEHKLDVDVWRSIWAVYDDHDFTTAPLWLLLGIPEIWVSGVDFAVTCDVCGRKRFQVDPNVRVPSTDARKPIVSVNGQFTIVRSDVAERIEHELQGANLPLFDDEGKYHYLLSSRSLRHCIVDPEQAIGFSGSCKKCLSPIFEMLFGPPRYRSTEWNGDDVIYCDFLSCHAFTPKAYELLRKVEKKVAKNEIVLLED